MLKCLVPNVSVLGIVLLDSVVIISMLYSKLLEYRVLCTCAFILTISVFCGLLAIEYTVSYTVQAFSCSLYCCYDNPPPPPPQLSLPGKPLPPHLRVQVMSLRGDADLFLSQHCTAPSQSRYTWCEQSVGVSQVVLSASGEDGYDVNKVGVVYI